jgi:aminoglycoside phosphotransferase family enzyme/predicted kinase
MGSPTDSHNIPAVAPSLAPLLTVLARPDCYPHHPAQVEIVQTHISAVFLAGDVVYKLKKPVRFSFLDYSTLALRQHYCQEEVRLNRRLAPTVYLGVVPIFFTGDIYKVEGVSLSDTKVVDYLVKMRRLPEERRLDSLVAADRVTKEGIHTLAKRLVQFHQTASTEQAALYGACDSIWRAIADNFQETAPFVGQTLSAKQYDLIRDFSQRFFAEHQELFRTRSLQGRVCEGHGDLRCEHVYFLDEGVTVVDCIEFSPRLRTCDVASELAFLTMDLELQGAPALAAELAHTYAVQLEDTDFLGLLPFYQCYRAYVRGKVESLKSREPEISPAGQERAREQARRAFRLATRYARGAPPPSLVVVCGRVGTGKSTVSRLLSEHTGFVVLNSDVVRKRLAGLLPTARVSADYRAGIYSAAFTRRTYATLQTQAEEELLAGRGVIVDATCKQPEDRQALLALGDRLGVPVLFLECRASLAEVERRLHERERRGDAVSDANWAVALREQGDFPTFADLPDRCHLVIDTEGAIEDALEAVEDYLSSPSPP